jgi:hypothetical protein
LKVGQLPAADSEAQFQSSLPKEIRNGSGGLELSNFIRAQRHFQFLDCQLAFGVTDF